MTEVLVAVAAILGFFVVMFVLLRCLERGEQREYEIWRRKHIARLNRYALQMRPGGKYYVPPRRKKREFGSCT